MLNKKNHRTEELNDDSLGNVSGGYSEVFTYKSEDGLEQFSIAAGTSKKGEEIFRKFSGSSSESAAKAWARKNLK